MFARILPSGSASSDTLALSVFASFSMTLSTLIIHFPTKIANDGRGRCTVDTYDLPTWKFLTGAAQLV